MNRFGWMAALLALSAPWTMGCPGEPPKVECTTPADCPKPTNACVKATCDANKCGTTNVAKETALDKQTAGDCVKVVCDGNGKTKTVIDQTDVLDDGNPCTDDLCDDAGQPTNDNSPAGTDCSASGSGTVCDGQGSCVSPSCGDGKAEGSEACDGTDLAGKTCVTAGFTGGTLACKSDCTLDTAGCTSANPCGNGALDGTEQCDGTNLNGKTCSSEGFTGGTIACKTDCTLDLSACTAGADCGNGAINGSEQCDGTNLNGKTCVTEGFASGTLGCNANCTLNTSACVAANPCGNGAIDGSEKCDGTNLNGKTCVTEGFAAGTLACKSDCTFDLAACTAGADCGNGAINGSEQCDGTNLNSKTCVTEGFASGTLACNANCTFNTAQCVAANPCGNGQIDGTEKCDTANLNGKTCVTEGFASGTLACKSDCTFDTTGCVAANPCGNGQIDGTEKCDTSNLNDKTCVTEGFASGTLACKSDCTFDTTGCVAANPCGNGQIDGTEKCDTTNLNSKTCVTEGFASGTLACKSDCTFDTTGCVAANPCGNSQIDGSEQCDKTNLNNKTCQTEGFGAGTLACKADCTFDTAGCGAATCGVATDLGTLTVLGGIAKGGQTTSGKSFVSAQFAFSADYDGVLIELREGSGLFTNGLATGSYTLSGAELAFDTCSLCVVMFDSLDKTYMPTSGSVELSSVAGNLTGMLKDVVFREVTINNTTGATTAVANGCASKIGSMPFDQAIELPPAAWTCNDRYYNDGDCDCGCGAVDPDCDDATADSCLYCDNPGSCSTEECPGNIDPNDNSKCVVPCGNGTLDAGEDCDQTNLNGKTCQILGYTGGSLACGTDCKFDKTGCTGTTTCGNGQIDGTEACDQTNLNNHTCVGEGFPGGGTLTCTTSCTLDTSGCSSVPTTWECDPTFYDDGSYCDCGCGAADPDCAGATLAQCNCGGDSCAGADCTQIDPSDFSKCVAQLCGNSTLDTGEPCDGTLFGTKTCVTEGFGGGQLKCTASCALDTSSCTPVSACGNNQLDSGEACDGSLFGTKTCVTEGFASGQLKCTASCALDTSSCVAAPACQAGEVAKTYVASGLPVAIPDNNATGVLVPIAITDTGAVASLKVKFSATHAWVRDLDISLSSPAAVSIDLSSDNGPTSGGANYTDTVFDDGAATSITAGTTPFTGSFKPEQPLSTFANTPLSGTWNLKVADDGLTDAGTVDKFELHFCVKPATNPCGNGTLDSGEPCDGTLFGTKTCQTEGFAGGTLKCTAACALDTSSCLTTLCGNGALDSGEPCDGALFGTKTCLTEGFTGGDLACSSTCTLVTTGCTTGPVCGNNTVETGEACDGTLMNGHTCVTEGFTAGNIACANCTVNTSLCTGLKCGVAQQLGTATPVDGSAYVSGTQPERVVQGDFDLNSQPDRVRIELYEGMGFFASGFRTDTFQLTGAELQYRTCSLCVRMFDELGKTYMATGGTVVLSSVSGRLTGTLTNVSFVEVTIASDFTSTPVTPNGCTSNIASMAFDSAIGFCGDGQVTGNEVCDGTNLNGITCASLGYGSGTPTCNSTCTSVNVNTGGTTPTVPGCVPATGETTDAQCLNGTDDNTNTWIDCEEAACMDAASNVCDSGIAWDDGNGGSCTDFCNMLDDCGLGLPDVFACNCSNDAGCNGIYAGYRCYTELPTGTEFNIPFCGPPCQYLGETQADFDAWCTSLMGSAATCNTTTGACVLGTANPCGNGNIDGTEQCDTGNLNGQSCTTVPGGFTGGNLACTATCTFDTSGCTTASSGHLVINEIDYDQVNTDLAEFVEIYNPTTAAVNLANLAVIFVNGGSTPAAEYRRVALTGTLPAGGYLVVHSPGVTPAAGAMSVAIGATQDAIQNGGTDGVALVDLSSGTLVDALSYEGAITSATFTGITGSFSLVEGTVLASSVADSNSAAGSLVRIPNGTDTDNANADWKFSTTSTPGAANVP